MQNPQDARLDHGRLLWQPVGAAYCGYTDCVVWRQSLVACEVAKSGARSMGRVPFSSRREVRVRLRWLAPAMKKLGFARASFPTSGGGHTRGRAKPMGSSEELHRAHG